MIWPCATHEAQELHASKGKEWERAGHILVFLTDGAPLSPPVLHTHPLSSLKKNPQKTKTKTTNLTNKQTKPKYCYLFWIHCVASSLG